MQKITETKASKIASKLNNWKSTVVNALVKKFEFCRRKCRHDLADWPTWHTVPLSKKCGTLCSWVFSEVRTLNSEVAWVACSWPADDSALSTSPFQCFEPREVWAFTVHSDNVDSLLLCKYLFTYNKANTVFLKPSLEWFSSASFTEPPQALQSSWGMSQEWWSENMKAEILFLKRKIHSSNIHESIHVKIVPPYCYYYFALIMPK